MTITVKIPTLSKFYSAFGTLGLDGRKGTQDDEDWYVLRRFLWEGLRKGIFEAPLSVRRGTPPQEPDFVLNRSDGSVAALVEITEATDPTDRREMAQFKRSKESAILLGTFGGRFSDGASQPGRAWAADVLAAIERKTRKSICSVARPDRHLVIFPYSNASFLLFDAKDECDAFAFLEDAIVARRDDYVRDANGCFIHVLGQWHICFDLLDKNQLARRK